LLPLSESIKSESDLTAEERQSLAEHGASLVPYTANLSVTDYNITHLLTVLLPAGTNIDLITTKFEEVGHIGSFHLGPLPLLLLR